MITILLVVGIRESAKVNNAIVTIKLVIIVVFILAGVWSVKTYCRGHRAAARSDCKA
ncbi:MAG: hypothetical protein WA624_09670 [Methylocella sp.]